MLSQDGRNEQVQYLLEEVFFSDLSALDYGLQGHDSTEDGFYAGALAAVRWIRKGMNTLVPGEPEDVIARLERFVMMLQDDSKELPRGHIQKDVADAHESR